MQLGAFQFLAGADTASSQNSFDDTSTLLTGADTANSHSDLAVAVEHFKTGLSKLGDDVEQLAGYTLDHFGRVDMLSPKY